MSRSSDYCPKGRKVALLRRLIIKMGQMICPKCDGNGWYVDDNGNEVNPCDQPAAAATALSTTDVAHLFNCANPAVRHGRQGLKIFGL